MNQNNVFSEIPSKYIYHKHSPQLNIKTVFAGIGFPLYTSDRLIFIMGIIIRPYTGKTTSLYPNINQGNPNPHWISRELQCIMDS